MAGRVRARARQRGAARPRGARDRRRARHRPRGGARPRAGRTSCWPRARARRWTRGRRARPPRRGSGRSCEPMDVADPASGGDRARAGRRDSPARGRPRQQRRDRRGGAARAHGPRRSGSATSRVNATGPFLLCRAIVPGMLERGWGRIVNVASTGRPRRRALHHGVRRVQARAWWGSRARSPRRPRAPASPSTRCARGTRPPTCTWSGARRIAEKRTGRSFDEAVATLARINAVGAPRHAGRGRRRRAGAGRRRRLRQRPARPSSSPERPMRIHVLGGGPAGLYFALLAKRRDPRCRVRVVERDGPDDTFGWGIVFSDRTLGFLREHDERDLRRRSGGVRALGRRGVDPPRRGRHHPGQRLLRHRAARLPPTSSAAAAATWAWSSPSTRRRPTRRSWLDCDLLLGADGATSLVRRTWSDVFQPSVDLRQQPLRVARHPPAVRRPRA